ncbi:acetoin utilization protein AcuC [Texcoconibacillus texcoconensis]|uniref:Acetoin utilization protein AcuC n=1 Tax=Texcoconibacillus texcoconensis TaxID=1095777 RepID=A0A840QN59_9BACI|nr:acetoin utilization protein AcuC [Texcoconibacillus texcoconensis]MBB5172771.1 acetoin utilization protein AcuC [Texcoconibacillus texcoconensis]
MSKGKDAVFIYSDEQQSYKFSNDHPFNQDRLKMTRELLHTLGALQKSDELSARIAKENELSLIHNQDFIDAVKKASHGTFHSSMQTTFGIGTDDTPIFPGMHEAASWLVGGTLKAVEAVFEEGYLHALNLGGGLHHGFRGRASGFCIYNDSSIAIQYLRKYYDAKVMYIDTDAHHGDGVQWAFYNDPNVCTVSLHESGRFLFPGTGYVNERGHSEGYGTAVNVPFEAFTEDQSWLDAYYTVIKEVAAQFKPDVILSQNGVDAHYYDPLTHLCTTMNIYHHIPTLAHELAHKYCNGRWIAVGGGGYDIWRVVPRAWSIIWLEMTDQRHLLNQSLPTEWLDRWQQAAPVTLPKQWYDEENIYPSIPRKREIEEKNNRTVEKALRPFRDKKKRPFSPNY